ncbi:MAG TPA: exopolysaccharide biosynthesis polyprenyl glycosylphosphotransferase [Acetobacteraceae bacterium]|nr:exopolysaccharide biosynthesis polyprenyl glycosylphosphotransferase [Acetobacteraceae bacterium]
MTRILGQYISLATATLGLVELVLSFLIVETLLHVATGPSGFATAALPPVTGLAEFAAVFALVTGGIATSIGLYRPEVCLEPRQRIASAAVAGIVAYPVLLLLMVIDRSQTGLTGWVVLWLGIALLVWQAGILLTHLAFRVLLRRERMVRRVIVVGSGHHAARFADMLRTPRVRLFEPMIAPTTTSLSPESLRERGIWGVVVTSPDDTETHAPALLDSKLRGARVLSTAAFCEKHLGRIDLDGVDAQWLLRADGFAHGQLADLVKRGLDIAVSLTLLVMALPVMLIAALAIKLESPGPVLYRQQRVGLYGTPFTLLKFRSMRVDAEASGNPRWAQRRDPRVTRVGRFIRPLRIDELPQLINVLLGEMSMIGPRPERPHFVRHLADVIPLYRQRSYVKPGVTGWAQVNYPYGASVEDAREKLAYDLYYIKNRSLLLDLLILFATVRVVLYREGAR